MVSKKAPVRPKTWTSRAEKCESNWEESRQEIFESVISINNSPNQKHKNLLLKFIFFFNHNGRKSSVKYRIMLYRKHSFGTSQNFMLLLMNHELHSSMFDRNSTKEKKCNKVSWWARLENYHHPALFTIFIQSYLARNHHDFVFFASKM